MLTEPSLYILSILSQSAATRIKWYKHGEQTSSSAGAGTGTAEEEVSEERTDVPGVGWGPDRKVWGFRVCLEKSQELIKGNDWIGFVFLKKDTWCSLLHLLVFLHKL